MFNFGKKKRYNYGEKIDYFHKIINDNNTTIAKKNWAIQRLNSIKSKKEKMKMGDVYVIEDTTFGNNAKIMESIAVVNSITPIKMVKEE